jgi:mannose-6-phosphate isomerase-like protein (cupin superfamily)
VKDNTTGDAPAVINLRHKLGLFDDQWAPKVVADMNDYQLKVVKVQGDFVWHRHDATDEVFMVISGELDIAFRDHTVTLREGEMVVVPKGMEHKPFAREEAQILVIEPRGVVNTGDVANDRSAPDDVYV